MNRNFTFLLIAGTMILQGCSSWQDCGVKTEKSVCLSRGVEGKKAARLYDAAIGAGAEATQLPDLSLFVPSCTRVNGDYKCVFKYHQPADGTLSQPINIQGDKAKAMYEALAAAGVKEDCASGSCTVEVVSVGCRNNPPACHLSRGSAMEVAW